MHQTQHDHQKSSALINDLGLAVAGSVGRKVLGIDHQQIEDLKYGPLANRITRLSEQHPSLFELLPPVLPPTDRLDDGNAANFERALRSVITDRESLDKFCSRIGQKLFEEGIGVPKVTDATNRLLRQVTDDLVEIKSGALSAQKSAVDTLGALRGLNRQLINFVDTNSESAESSGRKTAHGFGPSKAESLTKSDFWALDEQYRMIAGAIQSLDSDAIARQPRAVRRWLSNSALVKISDTGQKSRARNEGISTLTAFGIFEELKVGERPIAAQLRGSLSPESFEERLPSRIRERLGNAVYSELLKKYSGREQSITVAQTPEDKQIGGILDDVRVYRIAKAADVPPNVAILAMRYFHQRGLLRVKDGGYALSEMGRDAGLSVRICENLGKPAQEREPDDHRKRIEAKRARDAERSVARYQIEAEPHIRWVRGIRTPEIINDALLQAAQALPRCPLIGITDNEAPAIGQDKNNFSRANLTDNPADISLETAARTAAAAQDAQKLGAHFVGNGHIEWKKAEDRAYLQARRDRAGERRPSDEENAAATPHYNQLQNVEKKNFRPQIDALQEFIYHICQPFELKLGRSLHTSETLQRETGLDSNELEVVRDLAAFMVQDPESSRRTGKTKNLPSQLRKKIESEFSDHLEVLQREDSAYLDKLWRVVRPSVDGSINDESELRSAPGARFTFQRGFNPGYLVEYIGQRTVAPNRQLATQPPPLSTYIGHILERPPEQRPHLCVTGSGELGVTMRHGTWFVAPGTLNHRPNERNGFIEVSGGIDQGEVTQAISVQLVTPRILERLAENQERELPQRQRRIFFSSDQHIGSPAMKAESFLSGLLEAVISGADTIVLNGDLLDGANHTTLMHESQVLEHPLMGLEKQQEMVYRILDPVLDLIKARCQTETWYEIPTFVILPGNHETNSDRPGLQGTSFTRAVADHVRSYLAGMTNQDIAKRQVISPLMYTEIDGTPVKYPIATLDHISKDVGFTISVSHYDGRLGGGGPFGLASKGSGDNLIKTGQEPDINVHGHTHTAEVTTNAIGQTTLVIPTATGATPHSFHVGYRDAGDPQLRPFGVFLQLSSTEPPIYQFPTIGSLAQKEKQQMETLHDSGILLQFGTFKDYLAAMRREISLGKDGNPSDFRRGL